MTANSAVIGSHIDYQLPIPSNPVLRFCMVGYMFCLITEEVLVAELCKQQLNFQGIKTQYLHL